MISKSWLTSFMDEHCSVGQPSLISRPLFRMRQIEDETNRMDGAARLEHESINDNAATVTAHNYTYDANDNRQTMTSTALIEAWCRSAGHDWREQVFGPVVTLLACVYKQLQGASARQVEDWIASFSPAEEASPRDGSDFCAARSRLPLQVFSSALRHVGQEASQASSLFLKGLRVWLVDGTTLRTPNTAQHEKEFGRSRNAVRNSRSPLARMVVLINAGCGAVLDLAVGPYLSSELALFKEILTRLPENGVIVGDTTYGSFLMLCLVRQRGSHVLARHNPTRRGERVKRFGRGDELHRWYRPLRSQVAWPELLASCPEYIDVRVITRKIERRGYRTWTLKDLDDADGRAPLQRRRTGGYLSAALGRGTRPAHAEERLRHGAAEREKSRRGAQGNPIHRAGAQLRADTHGLERQRTQRSESVASASAASGLQRAHGDSADDPLAAPER